MLQKRNLVSNIPMHYSTATVYFLNLRSTKKISVFSITKNRRFSNLDSNFPLNGTTPFVAKGFGDVATEDGCDVQMLGVQSSLPENVKNGNVKNLTNNPSKVDFICIDVMMSLRWFPKKSWVYVDVMMSCSLISTKKMGGMSLLFEEIFSDFKPAEPRFFTSEREMGLLNHLTPDYSWIPFLRNQNKQTDKIPKGKKVIENYFLTGTFSEFFWFIPFWGENVCLFGFVEIAKESWKVPCDTQPLLMDEKKPRRKVT